MSEFNTKWGDNIKYEATIGELDAASVAALATLGIRVKNKELMGDYIVCKSLYEHKAFDTANNPVDTKIIGNGTKVECLITAYPTKQSSKHGHSPSLKSVTVTELVKYEPKVVFEEEDAVL